jgi:hypothetical protein
MAQSPKGLKRVELRLRLRQSSLNPTRKINKETTTLNRRRFLAVSTAAAAILVHPRGACAAAYDVVIKGGRVIDPWLGLDAIRDVATSGGKNRFGRGDHHGRCH